MFHSEESYVPKFAHMLKVLRFTKQKYHYEQNEQNSGDAKSSNCNKNQAKLEYTYETRLQTNISRFALHVAFA